MPPTAFDITNRVDKLLTIHMTVRFQSLLNWNLFPLVFRKSREDKSTKLNWMKLRMHLTVV